MSYKSNIVSTIEGFFKMKNEKDNTTKTTAAQFIMVLQGPHWPSYQELQDEHIWSF